MNIISNNCAGAFIYSYTKTEYNNPFMWSLLSSQAFETLMCRWDDINFGRISFPPLPETTKVTITVDGIIPVEYIHIKYDPLAIQPRKESPDVYVAKPYQYAYDKYIQRLKRMFLCKDKPIFLIADDVTPGVNTITPSNSISLVESLNRIGFKYRIIWATQHQESANKYPNLYLDIVHSTSQHVIDVAKKIIRDSVI